MVPSGSAASSQDELAEARMRQGGVLPLVGDKCDEPKIGMNKVVRANLTVCLGDVVSIHHCPMSSMETWFTSFQLMIQLKG